MIKVNSFFFVLMATFAAVIFYLNQDALAMQGLMVHYKNFARVILSGFDKELMFEVNRTFPMWGYGWLMSISQSKFVLVLVQVLLAIYAYISFWSFLSTELELKDKYYKAVLLVITLLIPLFTMHTVPWPNSIATSLIILSTVHLLKGKVAASHLVFSGILWGIALNFRSDFYLVIPFVLVLWVVLNHHSSIMHRVKQVSLLWLLPICLLMLPWMLYSKALTGHYLLSSTNAGSVFFIGLGQHPSNFWGIEARDADPTKARILTERANGEFAYSYNANQILKEEFIKRVKEDPEQFLLKSIHNLGSIVKDGPYVGEFYETAECQPECREAGSPLRWLLTAFEQGNWDRAFRLSVTAVSAVMGIIVVLLSYLCTPFNLYKGVKEKHLVTILLLLFIAYQTAISMFAFHMRAYTSNVLYFHLMNIFLFIYFYFTQRVQKDS